MTQPGYPGYGAPPPHSPSGYGPPQGYGGYGVPPHGPSVPPNMNRPKKSALPLILAAVGGVVVLGAIGVGVVVFMGRSKAVALPVDAKMLPPQTIEIGTQLIEASRETDEDIRRAYLAAELGHELCVPGQDDPADVLESMGARSPREAKAFFFDKKKLEDTGKLLECGSLLGASLDKPYQTLIAFEDGEKKMKVAVGHFKFTELPESAGFSAYTYRGIQGFCRTDRRIDTGKGELAEALKDKNCDETDHGAFRHEATWFLGPRLALESIAATVKKPKEELNSRLSDLKEAAAQTEGLPVVRVQPQPKTSREFFAAQCYYGALHSAVPIITFLDGCFPAKKLEKQFEEIDSKIKAAAYETDGDPEKAKAFHSNIIFVARDDDGAKAVEKDVQEVVDDWKTELENTSAKLINDGRKLATTARHKEFNLLADAYFKSFNTAKVTRKGRTIKVTFLEKLAESDVSAVEDLYRKEADKRKAVAQILDAIQGKRSVPEAPLGVLVGKPWAAYLTKPPPPGSVKQPLTAGECLSLQARIAKFEPRDKEIQKAGAGVMLIQHKLASCSSNPPEADALQRTCLQSFTTREQYAACVPAPSNAGEPLESEYGDRAKK